MRTTDNISIDMTGDRLLLAKFGKLQRKSGKRVLSKSVRAGGTKIVRVTRRNAPRDYGNLKKQLTQKLKWYSSSGTQLSVVGAKKVKGPPGTPQPVWYLHIVNDGAKAHVIRAKNKKAVALEAPFGKRVYKSVRHPGVRGSKFLDKSARQAEGDAEQAFKDKFATEVIKESMTP